MLNGNPYSYTYAKQHQIENDVFTMYDYFKKQSIIKRQSKLTGYSMGKVVSGTH